VPTTTGLDAPPVTRRPQNRGVHIVLDRSGSTGVRATTLNDAGEIVEDATTTMTFDDLPEFVRRHEAQLPRPRWVWPDTRAWYPRLLAADVRIDRCVDLQLCHTILRMSALASDSPLARSPLSAWDAATALDDQPSAPAATLFELDLQTDAESASVVTVSAVDEFRSQSEAVALSRSSGRLRLLLAAESAGALVAAEMRYAGLPYSAERHDRLLTELLGRRPATGARPAVLDDLVGEIRRELDSPLLNPDSPPDLLRALNRAGILATSTRSWELRKVQHPVIEPLLRYKKLSRLMTANGWAWLDAWISDGRFHPDYVPGGVVTGRWATRGGGALQLPRQVRGAVVADDGWKLIVADAAQLEPRILTGLSHDTAMAAAGRGKDLYEGIVASGAVEERSQAKVAMLGAMYGATTGESGRLMPRLKRAFPRAVKLVEDAAAEGEKGEVVTSRLGRSSPRPGASWHAAQSAASDSASTAAEERRARTQARDWGRFTRNFVVQASAAEWALCWMADLRQRLTALAPESRLQDGPHLVYFLHDEVIVHAPAPLADATAAAVRESAVQAGRLLFGDFPVEFPVTTAIVDNYAEAK